METNRNPQADAEEKLDAAEAALVTYVESKINDPELHKRLIEEVNRAICDYLQVVGQQ